MSVMLQNMNNMQCQTLQTVRDKKSVLGIWHGICSFREQFAFRTVFSIFNNLHITTIK